MKWRTFIVGYSFALGLLLLVQHRPGLAKGEAHALPTFRAVVDLTRSANSGADARSNPALISAALTDRVAQPATTIEAPALYSPALWTVGQIPPERLVAPLVVIDLREKVRTKPDYRLEVEDIADWEQKHGPIPPNAIVAIETGWNTRESRLQANSHRAADGGKTQPGFSEEAVKFLVQARETLALGTDAPAVAGSQDIAAVDNFTWAHSVYHLENLIRLDTAPATGSIVMVAPEKLAKATVAPVRVLAMVR